MLIVGEHACDNVVGNGLCLSDKADKKRHSAYIVCKVHLLGLKIDIARHDIVENDILYEGALVVLLVIQMLDARERNA